LIILINNNIDLINHILLNHFFLFFIDFDLTNISIIIILSKNLIILYSDINKFFIFNQKNVFDNLYFIFINVKNLSSNLIYAIHISYIILRINIFVLTDGF